MPMMWTAISEIKGRKVSHTDVIHELRGSHYLQLVYIISLAMFTAGSVAVALSPNMKR